jgi:hypothetical protein
VNASRGEAEGREPTANAFAAVEPVTGKKPRRGDRASTAVDMAHVLRLLSDEIYWAATVIVLVLGQPEHPFAVLLV